MTRPALQPTAPEKTFYLRTFGCKTNQYESQGIRESLLATGLTETSDPSQANVCIFNTCSVTTRADAGCRQAVRAAHRANPQVPILITGCAVDLDEDWIHQTPGIARQLRNPQKHAIADVIQSLLGHAPACEARDDPFGFQVSGFEGHTRAFLKVQDGCEQHCSYCTIPRARGVPVSRPLQAIQKEAEGLCRRGFQELVLTGINIGHYRAGESRLHHIVESLAVDVQVPRVRLGSVEPGLVTDPLLTAMGTHDNVCNHLHVPLQSGDNRVLSHMNRRYTAHEFLATVDRIRHTLPGAGITTDVIVGYPTEDEEAFRNTCAVCERAAFSRLHVFLFSPRPGTPAATLNPVVPQREASRWRDQLLALGQGLATDFAAGCCGNLAQVLWETNVHGKPEGYTGSYMRLQSEAAHDRLNRIETVRIGRHEEDLLFGLADADKKAPPKGGA